MSTPLSSESNSGFFYLHSAVLLFGGTALFSKLIPLGALDITMLRAIVAAFALALLVKCSKQNLALKCKTDYLVAIMLGVIVSLHWVTYFASMQLSSVAIGIISFFTYPMMTVLVEPFFTKSRLMFKDVLSGITVLIGVIILVPELDLRNDITLGIALGIVSAMLFTARNLLHKRYFASYSGGHAMFYQTAVAALFLMPWQSDEISSMPTDAWWYVVLLGVAFTAAPHALFTSALRLLSAKTISLVSCLQPLYASVLALIILGEPLTSNIVLGGTLIVATAVFETGQNRRAAKVNSAIKNKL
ncbi:DMT family transporter [Shewanella gelidii]|uniref:Membrane protein n=1 Tax=Shewanella gelidii TaxID=1642821 RepID=A0A917JQY6_9GAMM|nr:DMT family transporter [Shewanella gelidii]MCL1097734.1 DMT family transporter [Shewanella gelidii]GGI79211.1 membrane protein [Shewanella gelidii]